MCRLKNTGHGFDIAIARLSVTFHSSVRRKTMKQSKLLINSNLLFLNYKAMVQSFTDALLFYTLQF